MPDNSQTRVKKTWFHFTFKYTLELVKILQVRKELKLKHKSNYKESFDCDLYRSAELNLIGQMVVPAARQITRLY